jgi:hypothetical protein
LYKPVRKNCKKTLGLVLSINIYIYIKLQPHAKPNTVGFLGFGWYGRSLADTKPADLPTSTLVFR